MNGIGDISIERMKQIISGIDSTQDLVDAYVSVHNKFWFIEDDIYDYDEGTEEYKRKYSVMKAWYNMMHELDRRIMKSAAEEGLLMEKQED